MEANPHQQHPGSITYKEENYRMEIYNEDVRMLDNESLFENNSYPVRSSGRSSEGGSPSDVIFSPLPPPKPLPVYNLPIVSILRQSSCTMPTTVPITTEIPVVTQTPVIPSTPQLQPPLVPVPITTTPTALDINALPTAPMSPIASTKMTTVTAVSVIRRKRVRFTGLSEQEDLKHQEQEKHHQDKENDCCCANQSNGGSNTGRPSFLSPVKDETAKPSHSERLNKMKVPPKSPGKSKRKPIPKDPEEEEELNEMIQEVNRLEDQQYGGTLYTGPVTHAHHCPSHTAPHHVPGPFPLNNSSSTTRPKPLFAALGLPSKYSTTPTSCQKRTDGDEEEDGSAKKKPTIHPVNGFIRMMDWGTCSLLDKSESSSESSSERMNGRESGMTSIDLSSMSESNSMKIMPFSSHSTRSLSSLGSSSRSSGQTTVDSDDMEDENDSKGFSTRPRGLSDTTGSMFHNDNYNNSPCLLSSTSPSSTGFMMPLNDSRQMNKHPVKHMPSSSIAMDVSPVTVNPAAVAAFQSLFEHHSSPCLTMNSVGNSSNGMGPTRCLFNGMMSPSPNRSLMTSTMTAQLEHMHMTTMEENERVVMSCELAIDFDHAVDIM